ncbi:MAG: hypothetical protein IKY66_02180 [Bacteroidales bacterium]|nr:hypothetical protein [Bacteroidales bacterium]
MTILILLAALDVAAQPPEELGLDEYEMERLSYYQDRPLKINLASSSSLRSCGMLSAFQTESLIDYRSRHGDIMSFAELSCVDGFSEETVRSLRPYISLEGGSVGQNKSGYKRITNDLAMRGSLKFTDSSPVCSYSLKYRLGVGESLTFALATSSFALEWKPVKVPVRVILGDYNSRFGQGLALWNGMSMTGLLTMSSFYRSAAGLSSSWSFTGSSAHTGVALEYSPSRFRLSAMLSLPELKTKGFGGCGILPAVNLGWYGRNMCLSMTHYLDVVTSSDRIPAYISDMKTSADISMCIRGVDAFSEVTFDWVNQALAALAGTKLPVGEYARIAVHLRYYPSSYNSSRSAAPRTVSKCSNEYGASVCYEYSPMAKAFSCSVSLDSAFLPDAKSDGCESIHTRLLAEGDIRISESVTLSLRLSERYRTWGRPFKTDIRADVSWSNPQISVTGRVNVLNYVSTGFLTFLEGGYKRDRFSVYLKQTFFVVDNWDDRIYSYERDAPGNFSVPAFYGRGVNTALMLSWKFTRWGKVYLKGTMTSYPFMEQEKKKSGSAGLRLQFIVSF